LPQLILAVNQSEQRSLGLFKSILRLISESLNQKTFGTTIAVMMRSDYEYQVTRSSLDDVVIISIDEAGF
jgi:hypothetical protein